MTVTTVDLAMKRIAGATELSPIAVFRTKTKGYIDACFGSTTGSITRIHDNTFAGFFHGGMPQDEVRSHLLKVAAGDWKDAATVEAPEERLVELLFEDGSEDIGFWCGDPGVWFTPKKGSTVVGWRLR